MSEGAQPGADDGEKLPPSPLDDVGAMGVLRRGLQVSPMLRQGLVVTLLFGLGAAGGRLVVPLLIQQTLDRGITADGWNPDFIFVALAVAVTVIIVVAVLSGVTYLRLVRVAERTLVDLRVQVFAHLHKLTIARHAAIRKGTLTARVTSDIDQLIMFVQWGAMSWIFSLSVLTGTLVVMLVFSWQLTVVAVVMLLPLLPWARHVQRGQFHGYGLLRERVADTMSETSEAVTGAAVIRAYGYQPTVARRLDTAAKRHFRAQMHAQRYFSLYLPVTDVFGALALATTAGVGVWQADAWGLSSGRVVAFLFLVALMLNPITEITEVLDQTQTSLAAWRKVLSVLDWPVEVVEPAHGAVLPEGALSIEFDGVDFEYEPGQPVLRDVSVVVPAGLRVAVVGETGSGKTTFARLLARLTDPTDGVVRVGGLDLREVSADGRHRAVRMVPQDGFLFDASVAENVAYGAPGASRADAAQAFASLGLDDWLASWRDGLDTPTGARGDHLSVGERQVVALARAALASPGLLILDEATSAIDPETEQALARALDRLSAGRTTVSIAHRLSTAEQADLVLVFDAGRLVQKGAHEELAEADGPYAAMYRSWIGNTRRSEVY